MKKSSAPFAYYEEEKLSLETNKESSGDTMELRCRKRPRIEPMTVKSRSAVSVADNNALPNFSYDSETFIAEGSNADCALFKLSQLKRGLNDGFPNALDQIGIASPKDPAKNGWLSHHNGYNGILLACSNGLTAPVVKVNGFTSTLDRAEHVDPCCRSPSRRSRFRTARARHCNGAKIANAKDTDSVVTDLSFSPSLEAQEDKASHASESPDVVGSRSERALDVGVELPTGHCQQPKNFRKFDVLCKEKNHSSASSVSSTSGRSSVVVVGVKKERATCRWNDCGTDVEVDALLEHIVRVHVDCQVKDGVAEESKFVCLWSGCKFYNRHSVLRAWLERHIHCHLGSKPYRCIVAQCRMRFSSQFLLNRHINGHFSGLPSRPLRKGDVLQRKKKLRNTKPCPVKTDDFFDSAAMECVQNELIRCAQLTQVNPLHSGNTVTFQSYTVARRVGSNGCQETMLRWQPRNILPDEWVPESQLASFATKVMPTSRLPGDILQSLVMPRQPHHLVCQSRGKGQRK